MNGGGLCASLGKISACGYEGREYLLGILDEACEKAAGYKGAGAVLKICVTSPAVLELSDNRGFMRFERDIKIIYRGDML